RSHRCDDEDEQLDETEDADAEDLAHQQVTRPDGREDDLDDPTLLLLDHTGQHREAEAEDADQDQHGADVREQEAGLISLGLRVERLDGRDLLGSGERGLIDVRIRQDLLDPEGDDGARCDLGDRLVGLLGEMERPSGGEVRGDGEDGIDMTFTEGCLGRVRAVVGDDADLLVHPAGRRGQGRIEIRRSRLDHADRLGVLVAEQERRNDERPDDQERRERHGEEKAAVSTALEDLALGDEPNAPPAAHEGTSAAGSAPSPPEVGVTASMNSSDSLGGWQANVTTAPAARARCSKASSSTVSLTRSATRSRSCSSTVNEPSPSSHVPSDPTTSTSRWRRPERDLSSSMAPAATTRPRAMITTSSQTSSTRSSWWLEKTTPTPLRARSWSTSVIVAIPSGSRPENGSSSTSSSGSCASATVSWTRCWLPCDSSSSFDLAESATPIRPSQRRPASSAARAVRPCCWAKYDTCSRTRIRGYRPRCSGM